jgi:hypothetical protein
MASGHWWVLLTHSFECHADVTGSHCLLFNAHIVAGRLLTCCQPLWLLVRLLSAISGVGCSLLVIVVALSRHRPDKDPACRRQYVTVDAVVSVVE